PNPFPAIFHLYRLFLLRFSLQLPLVFPRKRFDDLLRKSHVLRRLKPAATVRHYYHDEYDVDMFQYVCDALSCPI
ncbi:MAG: hypothetical protein ACUZ9M_04315, partial [Candidatus Scalindua sp.]